MQTFLPYEDFADSASVLDPARLGKQRVEVLQVLRALELPDYGWANHPAVVMWRGRTPALVVYGLACVRAWTALGHADSTAPLITEFCPGAADLHQEDLRRAGLLPGWLGDGALHLSHRSALVRKDPARYGAVFGDVPDDLPYLWPGAGPDAQGQGAVGGRDDPGGHPLWVVRAPDLAGLGAFVAEGFVGLDAASGVDVDALAARAHAEPGAPPVVEAPATGRAEGPARGARRTPAEGTGRPPVRRRSAKAVRQLHAFLDEVVPGDAVALLADGERTLVVGRVSGDYTFRGSSAAGAVVHRRPVSWHGVLPRSAVRGPHLLQDPRSLFRVPLAGQPDVAQDTPPHRKATPRRDVDQQ